jgi:hypothetical protein
MYHPLVKFNLLIYFFQVYIYIIIYKVFASFAPIASYSACDNVAIHVILPVPVQVSQVFVT